MLTLNRQRPNALAFNDNPNDFQTWYVITFGTGRDTDEPCSLYRKHEPRTVGERPEPVDGGIRAKLAHGLAFWIQQDQDGVFRLWRDVPGFSRSVAGIVVFNGRKADKPEEGNRKEEAAKSLAIWSQWFNGEDVDADATALVG